MRQIHGLVHDQRERVGENRSACAGLDALGREMAAEGARARHRAEETKHMAGDGVQADAFGQLALDIGDEREAGLLGRGKGRRRAEQHRIDRQQPPGFLVGGAAQHDAVERA